MDNSNLRALLITVGGATQTVSNVINDLQPPYICFFVSPDTKNKIREEIVPNLNYTPFHYDWIETTSAEDLLSNFRALNEKLPAILEKWDVTFDQLGVDYTSGTKPMSVAVVLSTIQNSSQYFYVGAKGPSGRDRGGIGVVQDGQEKILMQTNPWEELAILHRKEIALIFNLGRFGEAKERSLKLAQLSPVEMKPIYEALAQAIDGYAHWDRFEYKDAQTLLGKALNILKPYSAGRNDPIHITLNDIDNNIKFLGELNQDNSHSHRLDVLDLISNADRRAKNANKYDDAVARLYSALEAIARYRLQDEHHIQNNKVKPEQIPDEVLRSEFVQKYTDDENPKILKLGLNDSYRLLSSLNDSVGLQYQSNSDELLRVLNIRNQSRLAHGKNPVRQEVFNQLRSITMQFVDAQDDDLPNFPTLRL